MTHIGNIVGMLGDSSRAFGHGVPRPDEVAGSADSEWAAIIHDYSLHTGRGGVSAEDKTVRVIRRETRLPVLKMT